MSRAGASQPEAVGAHMVPAIVCHPGETVRDVIGRMRSAETGRAGTIYVVDAHRRLAGQVSLMTLLGAPPGTRIRDLMADVETSVTPDIDQEHAASIAVERRVAALPVVDEQGRLVGVLPSEVLMEVLRAEHLEDLHRLAGVTRDQQMAREAIEAPSMRRARNRLPWLLIGLSGSAAATMIMAGFHSTLEASVAVAFFVPGIVYLADAIGTQTEAAAVRGLSLTREPLSQLVGGELRVGLLMGVTLAVIALPAVWLGFGDLDLAFAVAGAILCAGAMATTIGLLLPWFLWRLGRDPALGSGPLATVIQDVLSIVIYLAIVTVLVG
jgi:magnesium transporter